jgi:chemotaxis protein histidine kinase CheA
MGAAIAELGPFTNRHPLPHIEWLRALMTQIAQGAAEVEGKEVVVSVSGSPEDATRLEPLTAPLADLVRNAVVHGIERPAERRSAGKALPGRIRISFERAGDDLVIEVTDDGRGIAKEAVQLVFERGFSTREHTDALAGHGIGLSATRTALERLGGEIEVASELGRGTTFRIRLR